MARGVDVVVNLALGVILARYLGVEGWGLYTYVIAFVAIFVPLIDLGLDHILIREIARHKEVTAQYSGAILLLKALVMVVVIPLGMAVSLLIHGSSAENWSILFCFLGGMIFRETPTVVSYAVFLAYERMEFRVLTTFIYQVVKIAATLVVVFMGGGLVQIFVAFLIAEAAQGLMGLWLAMKKFSPPRFNFDWGLWKYLVRESLPIGIAFALNNYYFYVDVLFLKYFRTLNETGLYSVPFRVVTQLFTILIPTVWVLMPHLTRAARESMAKLDLDGQGYLKAIFAVTAGIAVYLSVEAREVTVVAFGDKFAGSAVILAIIAPVVISHAILYFFDLTLTAAGRQKFIIVGSVVIFAVKFLADWVFVPDYGMMGAAVSTLLADVVCFLVMYNLTRKYVTSFHLGSIMIRPVAAVLCAGILLWLVRGLPFYLTFVIFGLVYPLFIWQFRVISPDQKLFLKTLSQTWLRKIGLARQPAEN